MIEALRTFHESVPAILVIGILGVCAPVLLIFPMLLEELMTELQRRKDIKEIKRRIAWLADERKKDAEFYRLQMERFQ